MTNVKTDLKDRLAHHPLLLNVIPPLPYLADVASDTWRALDGATAW